VHQAQKYTPIVLLLTRNSWESWLSFDSSIGQFWLSSEPCYIQNDVPQWPKITSASIQIRDSL